MMMTTEVAGEDDEFLVWNGVVPDVQKCVCTYYRCRFLAAHL